MKKIIMLLLILLCLCACSLGENPSGNETSAPESSLPEENIPEEELPKPPKEEDPIEKAAIAEIRGMWLNHKQEDWEREGFSASPGNIVFFEDNVFSYSFNIKKDDYIISFPAKGTIAYNDMENFSPKEQNRHIYATWGCDGILDFGLHYFISLGKILFLDSDFEMAGQIFLPENAYYNMWPIGVAYSEELGYIVPVCKIPKDGTKPSGVGILYTFDENFELDKELGEIPVSYSLFGECYIPNFSEDSYLYYFDDTPFLSSVLEYNLDTNQAFIVDRSGKEFFDGEHSVAFIDAKPYVYNDDDPYAPLKNYVVLKEGNDILNYIELEEAFTFGPSEGIKPSVAAIAKNGNKAEVFDDFYHRVFSLNFRQKTVEYEYVFKEEDLGEPFDTSDDKKYSLHATSYTSGGDAVGFNVVLKNNETGEMHYMFPGGGSHEGFFKNGDIYHQTSDSLKIYSPKTREVVFALEDKFPLNADSEKGDYRILSAFRRDPETLEFMIVYLEGPSDISLYQSGKEKLPTYKIAFLDAEGNIKETYESEISVALGMYMWPQDAVIYYKNDKYTVTTLGDKNDKGINFTFDYNEKTFSKAKKNK